MQGDFSCSGMTFGQIYETAYGLIRMRECNDQIPNDHPAILAKLSMPDSKVPDWWLVMDRRRDHLRYHMFESREDAVEFIGEQHRLEVLWQKEASQYQR